MKKFITIITSLMIIMSLAACSTSKGSITSVNNDNHYEVIFKDTAKDMNVSTEMTLAENQAFTFDHHLAEGGLVKVEFKDGDKVVSELQLSQEGGGQSYDPAGKYNVVVTVLEKANGTLTIGTIDVETTDANMENPWTVAADLKEAVDSTGIQFHSPADEALPGDMAFQMAMYTDDILQANYTDGDNELIIRVSEKNEGKEELAGDYNDYPSVWTHSFKGLTVNLYGDSEGSIHLATFSTGGKNYAFSYNAYNGGDGLTPDELNTIFNGM